MRKSYSSEIRSFGLQEEAHVKALRSLVYEFI